MSSLSLSGNSHDNNNNDNNNNNKRIKRDVVAIAWEHYRNYVDSCCNDNNNNNGDGDVDELVELLNVLRPHVTPATPNTNSTISDEERSSSFPITTIDSLLSVLCSVAHYHLADYAIANSVDVDVVDVNAKQDDRNNKNKQENDANDNNHNDDDDESRKNSSNDNDVTYHLNLSLSYFPYNAATWSMGANYTRMTHRAPSLTKVCQWYMKAAQYASTLRQTAQSFLLHKDDDDNQEGLQVKVQDEQDVKEWIELLVMNSIVGAEYVVVDDNDDDDDDVVVQKTNENDINTTDTPREHHDNDDDDEMESSLDDNDDNDNGDGYYSFSSVEATSRFMAAMLFSTIGKHDDAKQQLQQYGKNVTHRLHPHVWTFPPPSTGLIASNRRLVSTTRYPLLPMKREPYVFVTDALPKSLYRRLCHVLAPNAPYWTDSNYTHRGYYSYFFTINDDNDDDNNNDMTNAKPQQQPTNLIEEVIIQHLLPRAQYILHNSTTDDNNDDDDDVKKNKIVGVEWWPHTRPIQANLGHQLHFDTDESLLAQEGTITHPILSSVLYLTTGSSYNSNVNDDANDEDDASTNNNNRATARHSKNDNNNPAGATIILNQTPDSDRVAESAWKSFPQDNRFMVFPGNLLHGVLPCPGEGAVDNDVDDTTAERVIDSMDDGSFQWTEPTSSSVDDEGTTMQQHRLTFMVGFWTRNVPNSMKERRLYGPCGPLPPPADEHSWVKEIQKGYPKNVESSSNGSSSKSVGTVAATKFEVEPLPKVSPAWESIAVDEATRDDEEDPPLELPKGIDHRFFVRGAPKCFRESLFQKDED